MLEVFLLPEVLIAREDFIDKRLVNFTINCSLAQTYSNDILGGVA